MADDIDWAAPPALHTAEEIAAEVARLHDVYSPFLRDDAPPLAARRGLQLEDWRVREVESTEFDPAGADDSLFAPVRLPDYRLAPALHYRHRITSTGESSGTAHLCFEAADYEAWVYWNGRRIGHHEGYFAPFSIDVSQLLGPKGSVGKLDVVLRRADDVVEWDGALAAINHGDAHGKGLGSAVADRVTAGVGLFGKVRLEHVPDLAIGEAWASGDPATGIARLRLTLANSGTTAAKARLVCRILPRNDAGGAVTSAQDVEIAAGATSTADIAIKIPDARVWSGATPWLYWADIEVEQAGKTVDMRRVPLAFRSFERTDDGTLMLNGSPCVLRGTTSIGCLWASGWSGDEAAVIRQLLLVKALFANTLRVHVHVLPQLVYDCADRLGVLIYQDAPWQWPCFEHGADRVEVALGMVAELARHLRGHPSVVILCLSNEMHMRETLHASDHAYLAGAQQIVRELAPDLVQVQDRTGPTRPRELVNSLHEYPGYFTGTYRSQMHSVADEVQGVRTIVSEYGAGAIESWESLTQLVAKTRAVGESLAAPATPDSPWTVEGLGDHMLAETLNNTQRVVGRQPSWRAYRAVSEAHQAQALSFQTGALRRDRARVSGLIQHYLRYPGIINYNPWCDLCILDGAGLPSAGFNALREAFRPLALDIVSGGQRAYGGASLPFALWIYNDLGDARSCHINWQWTAQTRRTPFASGEIIIEVAPNSSTPVHTLNLDVPAATDCAGTVQLVVRLRLDGQGWCTRTVTIQAAETPEPANIEVEIVGNLTEATTALKPFGITAVPFRGASSSAGVVIATPGVVLSADDTAVLLDVTSRGSRVILLERPAGENLGWLDPVGPSVVARAIPGEIIQPEQSLRDSGLTVADLSDWAGDDGSVVTHPLLALDSRSTPRWASCGNHLSLSAVHEFGVGHGSMLVCQALLWDHLREEPSAWRLLRHMMTKPYRKI